ncbi:MAG TPA: hypothetical protein VFV73_21460 [Streptosporangiaceae bacterium]|nr:hypothetical protein [Streptosporangiaceae bacterium]
MHIIKSLSRLGVALTTLGVVALGFVGRASAASAMVPRSGGGAEGNGHIPITPPAVHTVVVGGMPGWQIAAIAIAAALVAAVAAVLLDRSRRSVRRVPVTAA